MTLSVITRNFSRHSHLYDKYAHVQSLAARELIDKLGGKEYSQILDIGCGTGNYTLLLRKKYKGANITALDISHDMVDAARSKCGNNGIEFIVADAEKISFSDGFDLITSNATFQWLSDLEASVRKYRQALTSGGSMVFSVFGPLTFCELGQSLKEVLGGSASISAENFLGEENLSKIMKSCFREFFTEERFITEEYGSLKQLLDNIKYTGTRGEGVENLAAGKRGLFGKIEEAYLTKYDSIRATYQIFYCGARG